MEASAAGIGTGTASGDGQQGQEQQGQQQQQQQAAGVPQRGANGELQQQQQQTGAAGQEGQQQAPQGADAIAQMAETLQGLAGTQEEMRQFLASQAEAATAGQQQQTQTPATPPAADLSFLDETSPNYDPEKAAQRLSEVMRSEAATETQRLLQEAIQPLQQQVSDMQREGEVNDLIQEFPELSKPEVVQAVMQTANQYAEMVGDRALAANTAFVRMTYMAGRAAQLAQQQEGAAAGAGAATLEGAGGASPGGADQGATQAADAIGAKWAGRTNVLAKL